MKTPSTMVSILYAHVSVTALTGLVTGSLYKMSRPNGSTLEDIVINGLPVNGSQVQLGTANVNIYVPDLLITVGGNSQPVPDTARLEYLEGQAATILSESFTQTHSFTLGSITIIPAEEIPMHYINVRVDFQFFPS
ncbi:hypothetical protein [Spirosoma pollinicola]|uniref:Uncharacterized protein n=1 Tax=Spirosoma pollinicola TaxID=2057025 RepID=A0A2K8YTH6_9BACT|nr:hypothetical protein [Spirosoma pollinicola]AUD00936.1 hypothetical protein CWM47_03360 [Spirosoma pollinicola]